MNSFFNTPVLPFGGIEYGAGLAQFGIFIFLIPICLIFVAVILDEIWGKIKSIYNKPREKDDVAIFGDAGDY